MSLLLLLNQGPPYHQYLLDTADALAAEGRPEVAIVTAQMAAEIVTERGFATLFQAVGLQHLEEPVTAFFTSRSLGNERIRKVWNALADDEVQDRPFWAAFKEHTERRHRIVHRGERADAAAAQASIAAVRQFAEHVHQILRAKIDAAEQARTAGS